MATATVQVEVTGVPEVKAFFTKLAELLNEHPTNPLTKEVMRVVEECWPVKSPPIRAS